VLLVALAKVRGESEELVGQGSGRSVPGLELHEALGECGDLLLSHGGHAMAAGFRVRPELVDTLRERFCASVTRRFTSGPPEPRLVLDAEVPLSTLTLGLLNDLGRLEPYGSANRRPVFLAGGVEVVGEPSRIGRGDLHLSFRVRQEGTTLRAIAFNMGERVEELMSSGGRCCLAFTPKINEWNGRRNVEIEVVDLRPGDRAELV
jgi:single-stranded-DNA-specific exonuclease